jgi:signal transduction histidine kinase
VRRLGAGRLKIRTRVALWCAALVTASGALVLLGALVITQHTLDEHAPKPALHGYSTDPVVLRSEQFAAVEANRILVADTTAHVRNVGLLGLVALAVLSLGVGWLVAGRMLRPAARLARVAKDISASSLDRRVAADGPADELKVLADAFDAMLDRIDHSFAAQRRFVADASHELRTPFAAMTAQVDVALEQELSTEQLRRTLTDIGTVLQRGTALINAMLTLSRAEAVTRREAVDLAELVGEVVTSTPGADGLRVHTDLAPATVVGDPVLLEQLVGNLARNAVAYNVPGGLLAVTVGQQGRRVFLRVDNDGPLMDERDVPELFARFHRHNATATRPGFGLGLSVVGAIVTAHGAQLDAAARPEGGLSVTVRFPAPLTSAL